MSLVWKNRETDGDPTKPGVYAVMVSGDSEAIDGHTIYAFDDYQTWATCKVDEEGASFSGDHDEEDFTIFAYYGPIEIPKYEVA